MLDWKEHLRLAQMTKARELALIAAEQAEAYAKQEIEEKKRKEAFKLTLAKPWQLQSNNRRIESNIYRHNLISFIDKKYNNCYNNSFKTCKKDLKLYIYKILKRTISFTICITWLIGFINMNKNASSLEYMLALFSVFLVMFFVNYDEN